MCIVCVLAVVIGNIGVVILFALISFFALAGVYYLNTDSA
ncbi:Uncharacterised protein [Providencia stuartii]|nr:Uncharacterised protein [Providencia stuartii]